MLFILKIPMRIYGFQLVWLFVACLLVAAGGGLSAQEAAAPPAGQPEDKTPTSYDMKRRRRSTCSRCSRSSLRWRRLFPRKNTAAPRSGIALDRGDVLHTAERDLAFQRWRTLLRLRVLMERDSIKPRQTKRKIIEWLNKSFTHSIAAANSITNADYAKLVPKLARARIKAT